MNGVLLRMVALVGDLFRQNVNKPEQYDPADRDRALRIAASNRQVTVDVLPGGHWLHVDNPDGLLGKLLDYIG